MNLNGEYSNDTFHFSTSHIHSETLWLLSGAEDKFDGCEGSVSDACDE